MQVFHHSPVRRSFKIILRLSISASFWPNLWPSPETTLITVDEAPELSLPIRTVASADDDARTSAEVTAQLGTPPAPPMSNIDADGAPMTRELSCDLVGRSATVTTVTEDWQTDLSDGLFYYTNERDCYSRSETDPLSPVATCERTIIYRRPALEIGANHAQAAAIASADQGWDVELRTRSTMRGDAENFLVTNELVAYLDGQPFHTRTTSASIPRHLN